jgi:Insecticide toxin TcdB middle/N-terminal region
MRYLDLMGGVKPHLLTKVSNNLGAETEVRYTPSTTYYNRDKRAGTPWATKLPFPVQCVSTVIVRDRWRKTEFSSEYSYHHGFYDGAEREFCGFGRVDQVDTQRFDHFVKVNAASPYVTNDLKLFQPPVKTITWFHTGVAADRRRILGLFEQEYFPAVFADRLPAGPFVECELPQPAVERRSQSGPLETEVAGSDARVSRHDAAPGDLRARRRRAARARRASVCPPVLCRAAQLPHPASAAARPEPPCRVPRHGERGHQLSVRARAGRRRSS